jgi:hypothetical protein
MSITSTTLELSSLDLIHQLTQGLQQAHCEQWAIYVRSDGTAACQPCAGEHYGWHELVSLCGFVNLDDGAGRYYGHPEFVAAGLAAWIVQEHQGYLPSTVDIDGDIVDVTYL